MTLVKSGVNWLRHNAPWSNDWPSWRDRLVGLAFAIAAAGLIYLCATYLAFWFSAVLWAVFGVALALCSKQGWIKLFGPVLFYDMIRTARRSRYGIMRMLYAGFLFLVLCYMFLLLSLNPLRAGERLQMAQLAQAFFFTFVLLQLAMVVMLTPAYVAGAISEEKDRKTLEFLLATDLRNREIILSKLLSRLANMTLLLLTGLPILSILQFVGGVDPQLMLAGFAAIALTMLGLASFSILLSTLLQKPRDAISLTYLSLIAYLGLASVSLGMERSGAPFMNEPIWFGEAAPTLRDASNVLNAGNPIAAVTDVIMAIEGRNRTRGLTSLAARLPDILTRYAWFHLSLALVCILWSIARVRAIALKQTGGGTTAKVRWWQRFRPSVGDHPMFWKEFYIEGRIKLNWLNWLAVIVLVLLSLGSGVLVLGVSLWDVLNGFRNDWRSVAENMNIWFRFAGTSVTILMLLMLAVRASTSITHERERETFDSLVTTPMTAETMLVAKLVGNLASMRLAWFWYGSMLALAVCTGAVHPLAVPLLIGAWLVYATFVSMLGLWFSMLGKSSMLSTLYTVFATIFLGGGHWLITYCCCFPLVGMIFMLVQNQVGRDFPFEWSLYLLKFQAALTPPVVFGFGAFSWEDLSRNINEKELVEIAMFGILGLILWSGACVLLWNSLLVPTFRRLTRREELIYR